MAAINSPPEVDFKNNGQSFIQGKPAFQTKILQQKTAQTVSV
jgi:hypothetical protein